MTKLEAAPERPFTTMDELLRCSDVADRLPLHVGGDLDTDVETRVTEHIARCPACAELLERASRARDVLVGALLESSGPPASRTSLWPGIRARLVEEGILEGARRDPAHASPSASAPPRSSGPGPASPARARDPRSLTWSRRLGLVAAAAGLLLALDLLRSSSPGGGPPAAGDDPLPGVVQGPLVRTSDPVPVFLEVPGSRPSGTLAPVVKGGLRRVGLDQERLADRVRPGQRVLRWRYGVPVDDTNALAGYE